MPRLDVALEELRTFDQRPPVATPPIESVVARARRRRTHRRAAAIATVCSALVLVVAGVAFTARHRQQHEVRVVNPGPDKQTIVTAPESGNSAYAAPSTNLVDAQSVNVFFQRDPETTFTAQCAAEAVATRTAPQTSWCDLNVAHALTASRTMTFTVSRVIETGKGLIDCAEVPRRCVVGAYARDGHAPMWAPISFRTDLPTVPETSLTATPARLSDGARMEIVGSGYRAGEDVYLQECITATVRCDNARTRTVTADANGAIRTSMRASADILTFDGWARCEPCELQASARRVTSTRAPLGSISVGTKGASRPTVTIVESGPYDPGQKVTLVGTDFQPESQVLVGWCNLVGVGQIPSCIYPSSGTAQADASGSFTLDRFPLPDRGQACTPGRCGLAWLPNDGSPPVFVTPFALRQ